MKNINNEDLHDHPEPTPLRPAFIGKEQLDDSQKQNYFHYPSREDMQTVTSAAEMSDEDRAIATKELDEFYESLVAAGTEAIGSRRSRWLLDYIGSPDAVGTAVVLAGDGSDLPKQILQERPDFETSGDAFLEFSESGIKIFQGFGCYLQLSPEESDCFMRDVEALARALGIQIDES